MMKFFQKLFPKMENRLSKVDYWKKWDFFELFDDLHAAEEMLKSRIKNASIECNQFKKVFIEELYEIEADNVTDFTKIWQWFAPDGAWDRVAGQEGKELGKRIYNRVDRWKRNQDFIPGTKVSLRDEKGVVLNESTGNDLFGLIRWDTVKEDDVEDWRGMFGNFIQAGGQVINQDHKFNFIDDAGKLKEVGS
jgi:hypothetical protein